MKVIASALLLTFACSFAIDVDHDETTLGKGLFDHLKGEDPKKITAESLETKTKQFLDENRKIVERMLKNAVNKEIMTPKGWKTWGDMVEDEAEDVANKVGQLEAFKDKIALEGDNTPQQVIEEAIEEYFSSIAEALAKDVVLNHSLEQQV